MAEINLGKVTGGGGGGDVSKQSITSALGFTVKDIVIISQSEYDALPPFAREGERLFFIKDKLGKIIYKNEPVWDDPWDGTFADPQVGQILFDAELIADPTKSSEEEVAGITSIDGLFASSQIMSFDELKYFTGVTSLGDGCFYGSNLSSITLPEGVTSIGNACFENCNSLESITLPESLTSIGERCFMSCGYLPSITLPDGITSLGKLCISDCLNLKSVTLPESLTSLGEMCFAETYSLTSITLPESVTSIGDTCFVGTSLTSITIPESVTSIGDSCFSITDLTLATVLPTTPPSLGESAFYDGEGSILSIKVPSSSVNTYKADPNWGRYAHIISAI